MQNASSSALLAPAERIPMLRAPLTQEASLRMTNRVAMLYSNDI